MVSRLRRKLIFGIAAGVFALMVSSSPASAGSLIDFGLFGAMQGDIVDLGNGHIIGTGILINEFAWFDMPIGSGSMSGLNWTLDFDTDNGLRIHDGATDVLVGTFDPNSTSFFTGGQLGLFSFGGTGSIGATLAAFLGVDPDTVFDFTGSLLGLNAGDDHYTAFSSDIGGTPAVPEPGSMTLLGVGLIAAARGLRRMLAA